MKSQQPKTPANSKGQTPTAPFYGKPLMPNYQHPGYRPNLSGIQAIPVDSVPESAPALNPQGGAFGSPQMAQHQYGFQPAQDTGAVSGAIMPGLHAPRVNAGASIPNLAAILRGVKGA